MRSRESIEAELIERGLSALLADGFDECIIGLDYTQELPRVVYSESKCIEALQESGIEDYHEALEYFEFNVAGAYVGEQTPIFTESEDE